MLRNHPCKIVRYKQADTPPMDNWLWGFGWLPISVPIFVPPILAGSAVILLDLGVSSI
jgi:hypothetical protein